MNQNSKNTAELKDRIHEGDSAALDELYRSYFKPLKYFGQQVSPLQYFSEIDDLIQELFIWLAENHQKINNIDNLETYLFGSLKRNIYQEVQRRDRKRKLKTNFFKSNPIQEIEESVENKFIKSEITSGRSHCLDKLLASLPSNQKQVVYLRNYMNMSIKEVAQIMELPEQVVKNYSYRAMLKLRQQANPILKQLNS